ncbi:MAG: acetate kinase [Verrucomicrobiota bacterium]|jgi:acetate kinase|nr:acetate kinase [Verrucomicrobiota bacterium]
MKILILNAGSSSIKYQLMDLEDVHHFTLPAFGLVEKIGESMGRITHKTCVNGLNSTIVEESPIPTHTEGMARVVALLTDADKGVIREASEIQGVGHRVLSCGEVYTDPVLIDDQVKAAIREFFPLGPLHNPPNLMGIEVAQRFFPNAPQVAVFDTAFHQTMPPKAFLYAVPYAWYTDYRLRRYGFHGTSHKFITAATAEYLGKPVEQTSLISIHLGNGCSITAVRNGKSVDTSMGVTPLEGLVMGTRSGDLDPAAIEYIMEQTGMNIHDTTNALNKQSGLKGICEVNDMRDVVEAAAGGDQMAEIALQMFTYRIQKYIGAYMAVLPKLDAIVFTAGIGQNSFPVRARICDGLEHLGIRLDIQKNMASADNTREIQQDGAPIQLLVIPTNEELQIALETKQIIDG